MVWYSLISSLHSCLPFVFLFFLALSSMPSRRQIKKTNQEEEVVILDSLSIQLMVNDDSWQRLLQNQNQSSFETKTSLEWRALSLCFQRDLNYSSQTSFFLQAIKGRILFSFDVKNRKKGFFFLFCTSLFTCFCSSSLLTWQDCFQDLAWRIMLYNAWQP